MAHVTNTFTQYNVAAPEKKLSYHANRVGVAERFCDESVQRAVRSDLTLAEHLDEQLRGIELYLTQHARSVRPGRSPRETKNPRTPGFDWRLATDRLLRIHSPDDRDYRVLDCDALTPSAAY